MMKSQRILSALALLLPCFFSSATAFMANHASQQSAARRIGARLAASPLWVEVGNDSPTSSSATGSSREPLSQANGDLPTVIQQIADERQEFNMNLGKAMDTLRKDMPEILRKTPGKFREVVCVFVVYRESFLNSLNLYRQCD